MESLRVFLGVAPLYVELHGGDKQWRWLPTCWLLKIAVSRGRFKDIIAHLAEAIVEVGLFLSSMFGEYPWLQVSEVDLCADVVGWDISQANWQECFISHAVGDDGCSRDEAIMLESEGAAGGAGSGYWDE